MPYLRKNKDNLGFCASSRLPPPPQPYPELGLRGCSSFPGTETQKWWKEILRGEKIMVVLVKVEQPAIKAVNTRMYRVRAQELSGQQGIYARS